MFKELLRDLPWGTLVIIGLINLVVWTAMIGGGAWLVFTVYKAVMN